MQSTWNQGKLPWSLPRSSPRRSGGWRTEKVGGVTAGTAPWFAIDTAGHWESHARNDTTSLPASGGIRLGSLCFLCSQRLSDSPLSRVNVAAGDSKVLQPPLIKVEGVWGQSDWNDYWAWPGVAKTNKQKLIKKRGTVKTFIRKTHKSPQLGLVHFTKHQWIPKSPMLSHLE